MFKAAWIVLSCLSVINTPASARMPAYGPAGREVVQLHDEARSLAANTRSPWKTDAEVHQQADNMFQQMPRADAIEIGKFVPETWEPQREFTSKIDRLHTIIWKALLQKEPPAWAMPYLLGGYTGTEELRLAGWVRYDDETGERRRLKERTEGAFVFPVSWAPPGIVQKQIILNPNLKVICDWVGARFCAAILVHEGYHHWDHKAGRLHEHNEVQSEVEAYKAAYYWLKHIDPRSEGAYWLWVTYHQNRLDPEGRVVPQVVKDYVNSLRHIIEFGDRGDFEGLVKFLGYPKRKPHSDEI